MGLLDNLKKALSGSKSNSQPVQVDNEYEKQRLSAQIIDLANGIKRINSFDRSVWNLNASSTYELRRKSLDELRKIHSDLSSRLAELQGQSKRPNKNREDLEAARWTGVPVKGMSNRDLDRFQKGDDYR
ncbi:MAG: hypothetical protein IJW20_05085 [Clostridia bacterium]|nr:hypothetical protein [Clostridia bacterium]